ncbi:MULTISPECIES: glycosyl hydrolase family 17 protein [unclassified Oceanispirochaeta]|uniref:glycoside hydrolase family 17 protein n=1 Tax=unclassified Oceanispirochaeta TaxID=2635722 RepID=UPI000E08E7F4|nr:MULTISPECIES: glycosyl hydrolase family 17 protein [unclassified Oceanispirochaeta]MBF9017426.1 glycosyl hydrolase [Oceanispirochaeta sp. M2]NPD73998.1 glycosyl hydrolase [Oceanispirochaeta sp. M1]RDG30172.1 glycosyl hydrolase [Oceanispirochaeta sp. M1]
MSENEFKNAICYSGYRMGQRPGGESPSYEQIKEDLFILKEHWSILRLYDCSRHAETVLKVIEKEKLDLKVMIGAYIEAEVNNENCPWGGGSHPSQVLQENIRSNRQNINRVIELSNRYPELISSISVGNEAAVDWTDHMVPVERILEYVRMVKKGARQPVTYCENYVPWTGKLEKLVEELDFISIHTYPVWEYKNIEQALDFTKENYYSVANRYPHKAVVITEAGWTTKSNGRGIEPGNVSQELQAVYYNQLMEWSRKNDILTFVFEAFDEDWKGSGDALEPEKHWGLFTIDREPKLVMKQLKRMYA